MARHVFLKSVLVLATLSAAATLALYAGDDPNGPKEKAYGAFSYGTGVLHLSFEAPNKGSYGAYDLAGPWAGCWLHAEAIKLFFGTYHGNVPEFDGDPYVVVMGKAVAGEEFYDGSWGPIEPPYLNIAGFYKVTAFGDGGPGFENDWVAAMLPIPDTPEGLPVLCEWDGICGSGEEQAQALFDLEASGQLLVLGINTSMNGGDITVEHKDKADRR